MYYSQLEGNFTNEFLDYSYSRPPDIDCGNGWNHELNREHEKKINVFHLPSIEEMKKPNSQINLAHCGHSQPYADILNRGTEKPEIIKVDSQNNTEIDVILDNPATCTNLKEEITIEGQQSEAPNNIRNYDYVLRILQTIMTSLALLLLLFLRKIHCTRIFIHMNLLLSFVIRSVINTLYESINPNDKLLKLRQDFDNFSERHRYGDEKYDPEIKEIVNQLKQADLQHEGYSFYEKYKSYHQIEMNSYQNIYWADGVELTKNMSQWRAAHGDTPAYEELSDAIWSNCKYLNAFREVYWKVSIFLYSTNFLKLGMSECTVKGHFLPPNYLILKDTFFSYFIVQTHVNFITIRCYS